MTNDVNIKIYKFNTTDNGIREHVKRSQREETSYRSLESTDRSSATSSYYRSRQHTLILIILIIVIIIIVIIIIIITNIIIIVM